jgi:hypothetical protein
MNATAVANMNVTAAANTNVTAAAMLLSLEALIVNKMASPLDKLART